MIVYSHFQRRRHVSKPDPRRDAARCRWRRGWEVADPIDVDSRYQVRYRKPHETNAGGRGSVRKRDAEIRLADVESSSARGTHIDSRAASVTIACSGPPGSRRTGLTEAIGDAAVAADPNSSGLAQQHPAGPGLSIRLDTNDYSVDPTVIGRMVDITADLERVKVRVDGRIASDPARVWARGTTVTYPAHVETAARLRKQFQTPGVAAVDDDLARDLADYDRAFGLITDETSI